ncbi:hypothetical protein RSOLAG22IIIB_11061 [Rhizoctonia solani]|uniref:Protein kinase domain-containing protein n=1 Tax=Rhizoctonia solani TaxID=456999 RepID=A0A0K6G6X0_9AGAM|nr:hypothetical protein RSOLAG22IIIB_11061 [Rhizoctonia solani]
MVYSIRAVQGAVDTSNVHFERLAKSYRHILARTRRKHTSNKDPHPQKIPTDKKHRGINDKNGQLEDRVEPANKHSRRIARPSQLAPFGQIQVPEKKSSMVVVTFLVLPTQPISEILIRLGRHGCRDITSQLNLSGFGSSAVSTGGFGDVYQGTLQDGALVGIKCLRILVGMDDEDGKNQLKRAARELYVWSKCRHPNILDLLGVAKYDNRVAMVSPWMVNGNLTWYLTRYPSADRYNLCAQIADAIAFLRENAIVHGDIKGANILVSDDHIPKLTDFGNSAISECVMDTCNLDKYAHLFRPEYMRELRTLYGAING